jgi:hypothetical protein
MTVSQRQKRNFWWTAPADRVRASYASRNVHHGWRQGKKARGELAAVKTGGNQGAYQRESSLTTVSVTG